MSKINFPKKQEQRLIPKYLLEYAEELQENHPDPTAEWGGGSGGEYTAGTGIIIDDNEISVDTETIPTVAELSTVAFSGSYLNLSDKPDLNVYELKEDAFTGDYGDLTNKPDLSVYELKTDAFSGDYNDLTNKPSIPTKTSELNNDSNFIPSDQANTKTYMISYTAPFGNVWSKAYYDSNDIYFQNQDGYSVLYFPLGKTDTIATLSDIPNVATVALTGDYDDLVNKPTIPTATSQLTNDSGFITSSSLTNYVPFETVSGMKYVNTGNYYGVGYEPGLTNYNMITSTRNTFKLPIDKSGTIALTSDITNVSGTNDGTNWTTLTIGSDTYNVGGGSTPSNYVTTDTNQQITGEKTFVGEKRIKFKQSTSTNKLGFTCYDNSNREKAYLEYNPQNDGLYLGRYGAYGAQELGFKSQIQSNLSITHNLLVPNITLTASRTDYIPISVNGARADSSGNISISIPTKVSDLANDSGFITSSSLPDMTNYYTKTEINTNYYDRTDVDDIVDNVAADIPEIFANQPNPTTSLTSLSINNTNYSIPSSASSTSTVTPSTSAFVTGTTTTTETLTFTYTDNTTANITIVTSVTDSTSNAMTGATVSTSTTLS